MKVLIHILTYNSEEWIVPCIESVLAQDYPVSVFVTDNRSHDKTVYNINKQFAKQVTLRENSDNLGFSAGHNQAAADFLNSDADILLIINPDVVLEKNFVGEIVKAFGRYPKIGAVCGKLLRAEDRKIIDSTGIVFTKSLRHFDRGSEQEDRAQYDKEEFVVGATGACVAFTRKFIENVSFRAEKDSDSSKIYPQLAEGSAKRVQLFDEAFFAYREDADLAWRAASLGERYLYTPNAVATHIRRVTPERRSTLPVEINSWSVRNRFLMQVNNFRWSTDSSAIFSGLLVRNLLVVLGILVKEHSSLIALKHFFILLPRALARRKMIKQLSKNKEQYGLF